MRPPSASLPFLFLLSIGIIITMMVSALRFFAREEMVIFENSSTVPQTLREKVQLLDTANPLIP